MQSSARTITPGIHWFRCILQSNLDANRLEAKLTVGLLMVQIKNPILLLCMPYFVFTCLAMVTSWSFLSSGVGSILAADRLVMEMMSLTFIGIGFPNQRTPLWKSRSNYLTHVLFCVPCPKLGIYNNNNMPDFSSCVSHSFSTYI